MTAEEFLAEYAGYTAGIRDGAGRLHAALREMTPEETKKLAEMAGKMPLGLVVLATGPSGPGAKGNHQLIYMIVPDTDDSKAMAHVSLATLFRGAPPGEALQVIETVLKSFIRSGAADPMYAAGVLAMEVLHEGLEIYRAHATVLTKALQAQMGKAAEDVSVPGGDAG